MVVVGNISRQYGYCKVRIVTMKKKQKKNFLKYYQGFHVTSFQDKMLVLGMKNVIIWGGLYTKFKVKSRFYASALVIIGRSGIWKKEYNGRIQLWLLARYAIMYRSID